jgi:hypothetical protein
LGKSGKEPLNLTLTKWRQVVARRARTASRRARLLSSELLDEFARLTDFRGVLECAGMLGILKSLRVAWANSKSFLDGGTHIVGVQQCCGFCLGKISNGRL